MRSQREKRGSEKDSRSGAVFSAAILVLSILYVLSGIGVAVAAQDAGNQPAESEEELMQPYNYVYDPKTKTDPFKPFILTEEEMEAQKKKKRTYLETLDVSQLELIAIVVGPKGNFAMVRDAKGLGYVIQRGTPIGINGGVVFEVNEREVVIKEKGRKIFKRLVTTE
jgi:Tfp pilus assembly protein PilP